ncbi:Aminopeptidase YpdF (MP-, MA-, MS-,AP-,NP-specific) [Pseudoalteromonas luteoviolacea B = ATCC 29581]|nr:Aminopeptidase YpdF (MP-, MA-, MS-,AP-,NP-specific) [Pseudoalteromonas luteoviolacea B = ATCC 29581]
MNALYLERQRKLQLKLNESSVDALLILGFENIRYLTGYSGNAAYLLFRSDGHILITDYRYYQRALNETVGATIYERDREAQTLGEAIKSFLGKSHTLGFESNFITVGTWQEVLKSLDTFDVKPVNGLVESIRARKEPIEIAAMRKAAAIADEALSQTLKLIETGVTERDLALELDYRMKKLGSDGVSFDTILLFGERSALPHGKPGDTALSEGDFILVDFGAVINGYRSDMTRTYVHGEPSAQQRHMYEAVEVAQRQCFAQLAPGISCKTLNAISEQVLTEYGYKKFAGKGLGHGVGLFLHEFPFINRTTDYALEVGNVITIEPGVYLPEIGGVRLEDDVLITEHGFEFLTHAPKHIHWK